MSFQMGKDFPDRYPARWIHNQTQLSEQLGEREGPTNLQRGKTKQKINMFYAKDQDSEWKQEYRRQWSGTFTFPKEEFSTQSFTSSQIVSIGIDGKAFSVMET